MPALAPDSALRDKPLQASLALILASLAPLLGLEVAEGEAQALVEAGASVCAGLGVLVATGRALWLRSR